MARRADLRLQGVLEQAHELDELEAPRLLRKLIEETRLHGASGGHTMRMPLLVAVATQR